MSDGIEGVASYRGTFQRQHQDRKRAFNISHVVSCAERLGFRLFVIRPFSQRFSNMAEKKRWIFHSLSTFYLEYEGLLVRIA